MIEGEKKNIEKCDKRDLSKLLLYLKVYLQQTSEYEQGLQTDG